ncbi:hypothetical protein BH09ACT1_BH09ACT1_18480 [soil metagenome]
MVLTRLPLGRFVAGWLAGILLLGGLGMAGSTGSMAAVLAIAAVTIALGVVVRVAASTDASAAPGISVRDFGSRAIRGVVPLLSDPQAPGRSLPRAPAEAIPVA